MSQLRFQKLSNKMTVHWSKKLDPYLSIEDMMKTNKGILHTLAAVNNLNTACYVIQTKKSIKITKYRVSLHLSSYTKCIQIV